MKVIISGGSGLVGRALTDSLCADGHEVVILSRSPQRVKDLPSGARAVAWDARTPNGWVAEVEGAQAIVNLAGASLKGEGLIPSRWTKKRKALLRQSRLDAGAAVLEAVRAVKQKPDLVIQSSAVGYYGPHPDEPLDESAPPADDFLARICVDWEASTRGVEQMGVRHCVVRSGLVLSTQGGSFPLLALPFKLFSGNWFGDGRQVYSWIHLQDHVAALRFLLESGGANGAYNLTAPGALPNREFARTMGRVLRRPVWMPVPGFALRLALGEVASVVLDGQRVVPAKLQREGFGFRFPELEPALRDLFGR